MKTPGKYAFCNNAQVKIWIPGTLSSNLDKKLTSSHSAVWHASQVIGPPDVYPRYGDLQNAWAQAAGAFTRDQGITVVPALVEGSMCCTRGSPALDIKTATQTGTTPHSQ